MILKELRSYGAYSLKRKDLNISLCAYNREVKILTWPQVTDIKIWDIQAVGTRNVI